MSRVAPRSWEIRRRGLGHADHDVWRVKWLPPDDSTEVEKTHFTFGFDAALTVAEAYFDEAEVDVTVRSLKVKESYVLDTEASGRIAIRKPIVYGVR